METQTALKLVPGLYSTAWKLLSLPGPNQDNQAGVLKLIRELPQEHARELIEFLRAKAGEELELPASCRNYARLQSVLASQPEFRRDYLEVSCELASRLQARGKLTEALAQLTALRPAIEREDSFPKAAFFLKYSLLLFQLNSTQAALKFCDQAVGQAHAEFDPEEAHTINLLAVCQYNLASQYLALQNWSASRMWYKKALTLIVDYQRQQDLQEIVRDCTEQLKRSRHTHRPRTPADDIDTLTGPFLAHTSKPRMSWSRGHTASSARKPPRRSLREHMRVPSKVSIKTCEVDGVPVEVFLIAQRRFEIVPLRAGYQVLEVDRNKDLPPHQDLELRVLKQMKVVGKQLRLQAPAFKTMATVSGTDFHVIVHKAQGSHTVLAYKPGGTVLTCEVSSQCPVHKVVASLRVQNNQLTSSFRDHLTKKSANKSLHSNPESAVNCSTAPVHNTVQQPSSKTIRSIQIAKPSLRSPKKHSRAASLPQKPDRLTHNPTTDKLQPTLNLEAHNEPLSPLSPSFLYQANEFPAMETSFRIVSDQPVVKDVSSPILKPKSYEFAKQMVQRQLLRSSTAKAQTVIDSRRLSTDDAEYQIDLFQTRRARMLECTHLSTGKRNWVQVPNYCEFDALLQGLRIDRGSLSIDYSRVFTAQPSSYVISV